MAAQTHTLATLKMAAQTLWSDTENGGTHTHWTEEPVLCIGECCSLCVGSLCVGSLCVGSELLPLCREPLCRERVAPSV